MNAIIKTIEGIEVKAYLEYVQHLDEYAVKFEFETGHAAKCTIDEDGKVSWFAVRNDVHDARGIALLKAFDVAVMLHVEQPKTIDPVQDVPVVVHITEDAPVKELSPIAEQIEAIEKELTNRMVTAKLVSRKDYIFFTDTKGRFGFRTLGHFIEHGLPYKQQGLKSIMNGQWISPKTRLGKLETLKAFCDVLGTPLNGLNYEQAAELINEQRAA